MPPRRRDAFKLPKRPSLRACIKGMLRELFGRCTASEATHVLQGRLYSEQIAYDQANDRRHERELHYYQ